MRRCDVLVVGGGAIGSATAWQLAKRGVDVVLLERWAPGHHHGSSHGASRIFRLAYAREPYGRLALEAAALWRELEEESGQVLLEVTGGLDIGSEGDLAPIEATYDRLGVTHERVGAPEATDRWPGIAVDGHDDRILHSPDAGRLWSERAVRVLHERAAACGAEVRTDEPALIVSPKTGHVGTDADEYLADSIVVTAGAWTPGLLAGTEEAEGLPELTVTREQTFHFPPLDDDLAWPSFIHHRGGGLPIVYGLETPGEGVKVAEDHAGAETDPDDRSFEIDQVGRQRLIRYVTERLPGLDPKPVTELTCLYTSTADGEFVLERRGRLVIGSACSGHGFKFTPRTGALLADLALLAR
jgi:sarcosine oxidase